MIVGYEVYSEGVKLILNVRIRIHLLLTNQFSNHQALFDQMDFQCNLEHCTKP